MTDAIRTITESFARAFDSADDAAHAMRIVDAAAGVLRAVILANPDPQKRNMLELRFDGDGDGSWYVAAWSAESAPVAIAGYMRERDEALAEAERLRRKLELVKPYTEQEPVKIECSFCGASPTQSALMIAGPNPRILVCGECVGIMVECIADQRVAMPRSQRVLSGWARLSESYERAVATLASAEVE